MKKFLFSILSPALLFVSCQNNLKDNSSSNASAANATINQTESAQTVDVAKIKVASAKSILDRKQVPILCYHQVRNWKPTDGKVGKDYIVEIKNFENQIKMLVDSGYQTILPDQLFAYLNTGAKLPKKPIMLTFDDTDLDQFTVVRPTLKKYGIKRFILS